jgi:hypothetical protein
MAKGIGAFTGPREIDLAWDDPTLLGGQSTIETSILTMTVNYSMDMASEISVEVHDPAFELARNNYFSIGRTIWYRSWTLASLESPSTEGILKGNRMWQRFEIANATMGPGPALSAVWTLRLRPQGVQQLKRHKQTDSKITGTGHQFIANAANFYGMDSVTQETTKGSTWKSQGSSEVKESAWDVMRRIAGEDRSKDDQTQFMLYEADGVIFFGTQRWLLGRWGMTYVNKDISLIDVDAENGERTGYNYIHLAWPPVRDTSGDDVFQMVALPRVTRTDNDPIATEGSLQLDRFNARALRPGMTIFLDLSRGERGTNYFNGMYLINSVSFDHFGTNPVSIQFRSPERLAKNINVLAVGASGQTQTTRVL